MQVVIMNEIFFSFQGGGVIEKTCKIINFKMYVFCFFSN